MKKLFFILLSGLGVASCSQHYYYAPNTLHLPSVSKKGQLSVEASLNGSSQIKGSELRTAWMPTQNTSIMANFMYLSGSFEQTNFFVFPSPPPELHTGTGHLLELGITKHFPTSKNTSVFSITSGAGLGTSINTYGKQKKAALDFSRYFIQPAFMSYGKMANIGVGFRLAYLNFYKGTIDYTINESDLSTIQNIEKKAYFLLPDVGFTAGVRFDPVEIRCNITLGLMPQPYYYGFSNNNLSISALTILDTKPKSKSPTKSKKQSKKKKRR
jgi:hypothetical protein